MGVLFKLVAFLAVMYLVVRAAINVVRSKVKDPQTSKQVLERDEIEDAIVTDLVDDVDATRRT